MIQLSKRLNAVAELLVHGIDQLELEQPVLADIGTDHAYLPVYLVQKKVVKKAYAADVRKGPLLHAKEHIEQYGLGEYIQTRLSDGGESFVPGESEVAVIAGMGGGLMQKILSGSPEFFEKNSCVVLQPQSEIEQFRRFLTEDGWCILEEDMDLEDGKLSDDVCDKKRDSDAFRQFLSECKGHRFFIRCIFIKRRTSGIAGLFEKRGADLPGIIRKAVCDF